MNYPYYKNMEGTVVSINDAELLKSIALHPNLTQYVRIHILNMNETEVGLIQGRVTSGNVSLNSSSPVRRSGSLSLVADKSNCDITNIENIISINKRAKIEIGIENVLNNINPIDDKIWFKLGTFVLTNASLNKSLSGFTMSVNLKDKMALLNGECGGTIYTSVTHSPIYNADGTEEPVPMYALIKTLVSDWGKIPDGKILIEGIEENGYVKNTYSWQGNSPLYVGINHDVPTYVTLISRNGTIESSFSKGEAVGYSYKKLVYPGELTSAVGESIQSVLEKIKKALGNYEYFFDVDGNFVFRPIPNGLNEGSAFDDLSEAFGDAYLLAPTEAKAQFDFEDEKLLVSCSSQPKYEGIKNDYVVWGAKGTSKTPIRYHLAIDTKPSFTAFEKEENCYQDSFGYWRIAPTGYNGTTEPKVIKINDWRAWLYYDDVANNNPNDYGQELKVEFPKQYDLLSGTYYHEQGNEIEKKAALYNLVYWLDFLDPNDIEDGIDANGDTIDKSSIRQALNNMSVTNIGRRTKTVKDENINCIFNIRPIDFLLIPTGKEDTATMRALASSEGENYYQINDDISNRMSLGLYNNAAYDTLRASIHETTAYNDTISLTTIPMFHLEPNMRIGVHVNEEDKSIIDGEYMINSMSVPLAYNGNMSISASRAIERI